MSAKKIVSDPLYACVAVRLPDGSIATARRVDVGAADAVQVVHEDQTIGRGPFVFDGRQLEIASDTETKAYEARCEAHLTALRR